MIKKLDMFEFGTYEEAVSRGCKQQTTTKWVDTWKADDQGGRFVRCRLVGRDFKVKGVEEIEDLCGNATSGAEEVDVQDGGCGERAPEETGAPGGEADVFWRGQGPLVREVRRRRDGKYARLQRWLYGMRKAAAGWRRSAPGRCRVKDFAEAKERPRCSSTQNRQHGSWCTATTSPTVGTKKELEKIKEKMGEWYVIKERETMGCGKNEIKEVTILRRTVRWTAEGLEYEADAEHRRRIMEAEGLAEDSKAVPSLAVKEDNGKAELAEKDLDTEDHRRFRGEGATSSTL